MELRSAPFVDRVRRLSAALARLGPWPFILLAVVDRALLVEAFGSRFVSTDDAIMWAAAVDYGKGIFHAPYFYGQNYGPMLEALIAAPFTRLGLPMQWLMPSVSSLLALLPYWSFALWDHRQGRHKAALLWALVPLLMPVEYGMMTTLPRGFVNGLALLAFLPWILELRTPTLRSALTGSVVAAAWAINPNSAVFSVGYVLWYLLKTSSPIRQALALAIGTAPALVLHELAQAWCRQHADRLVHRMESAWPVWDLPRILESLGDLEAHFRWLMPVFWPFGQWVAVWLLVLMLLAHRARERALFFGLVASTLLVLASFTMDKVHDGWGTVFYPLSRMFLALPVLLTWATAMLLRPGRLFRAGVLALLVIAVAAIALRAARIDPASKWQVHAQRDWVGVQAFDFLNSHAHRLRSISERYQAELIVMLPFPTTIWQQFRTYLYPVLVPDLPPTYSYGYERRYWWSEGLKDDRPSVILFVGGATERWAAILAEDGRFVPVEDDGPDKVYVFRGSQLPADSVIHMVHQALTSN